MRGVGLSKLGTEYMIKQAWHMQTGLDKVSVGGWCGVLAVFGTGFASNVITIICAIKGVGSSWVIFGMVYSRDR